METFVDDESGFRTWKRRNRSGYLVNTHREPKPSYMMLHIAKCIEFKDLKKIYTKDYIKICSTELPELHAWAAEGNGRLQKCEKCKPN